MKANQSTMQYSSAGVGSGTHLPCALFNFTLGVNDLEDMRRAKAAGRATLAANDKAEIRLALPDGSEYGATGTLDFSDTTVDPATGAVSLRGQIPNPDRSLLPGMYVTIKATLGQQHDVFKVPQAALQRDATGPFVLDECVTDRRHAVVERERVDAVLAALEPVAGRQLDELQRSPEFELLLTRAGMIVDRLGAVNAYSGEALGRLMGQFQQAAGEFGG